MIGCLLTRVRKQPIIALFLCLRLYSSFITLRPDLDQDCFQRKYNTKKNTHNASIGLNTVIGNNSFILYDWLYSHHEITHGSRLSIAVKQL